MQALAPTGDRNPNDHDQGEIITALHGTSGARRWSFRYELLDSTGDRIRDLDGVRSGSVEQAWLAGIKRTARFEIREDSEIDYLSDRIKPYVRLHLPPFGESDWVEWPQGVFLLSSPTRSAEPTGQVTRQIDGYDLLQLYADDDASTDRYVVASGAQYTDAVRVVLDTDNVNIPSSAATLPVAREWDPGTSRLQVANELLAAINYNSLSIDEDGVPQAHPYTNPADRSAEYTYVDDGDSVIIPGGEQTLDLFSVPNRWVRTVSQPDRPVITSTFINNNPASPTSTIRRARTITDHATIDDAADQDNLDAIVERIGREASQIYESIEWRSSLMPFHSGNDVYRLRHTALSIDADYSEEDWTLPLTAGAEMRHSARRVVQV